MVAIDRTHATTIDQAIEIGNRILRIREAVDAGLDITRLEIYRLAVVAGFYSDEVKS